MAISYAATDIVASTCYRIATRRRATVVVSHVHGFVTSVSDVRPVHLPDRVASCQLEVMPCDWRVPREAMLTRARGAAAQTRARLSSRYPFHALHLVPMGSPANWLVKHCFAQEVGGVDSLDAVTALRLH